MFAAHNTILPVDSTNALSIEATVREIRQELAAMQLQLRVIESAIAACEKLAAEESRSGDFPLQVRYLRS